MFYYRIDVHINNYTDKENAEQGEAVRNTRALRTMQSDYSRSDSDGTMFISSMDRSTLGLGALAKDSFWLDKNLHGFLAAAELDYHDISVEETTLDTLKIMLRNCPTPLAPVHCSPESHVEKAINAQVIL